jgi:hypothetical protein
MKASKETGREIRVDNSDNLVTGASELEVEEDVTIPKTPLSETKIAIYTVVDIRAAFEAGAAFQRQSIFTPQATNAIKAREEALARWPE